MVSGFMMCHPYLAREHKYIIVIVEYFTKWDNSMPTFSNNIDTITLFIFNQVIARINLMREIVINNGSNF